MTKRFDTIELRHLRYFVATAEHGSFRKAGSVLGICHSAISRRIRDLEDHIGASLFHRHTGGVSLTYAGERFLRKTKQGLEAIHEGTCSTARIGRGEEGVVRVGLMSSMASGFIAELLGAYSVAHAEVRIEYAEGDATDHVPAIQQHRLDIAFLTGTPSTERCDVAHLWTERIYVAMSERHELSEKREIAWSDLRGRSFIVSEAQSGTEIHDYLVKHLADLGHTPSIQRHAVYRDTLMQIVANGQSLTLTSEATIAAQFPGVAYRLLSEEVLPFCAIWSPHNDNPALRRLLSLAKVISSRFGRHDNSYDL